MACVVDKETYKVVNYMKNFAWNVQGASTEDNTPILGYAVSGGANNERWIAAREDGDYFSFTTRSSEGIRKVLEPSKTSAGQVVIFTYSGGDSQQWMTEPVNTNNFLCYIKNKNGNYLQYNGDNQPLSLVPKGTANKNQYWSIQELDTRVCADAGWLASLTPKKGEEERKERERIELERIERERIETERIETERIERERVEREEIEREKLDLEGKLEFERIERERIEHERIERERIQTEPLERERIENERVEKERIEREKREEELREKERLLEEKERRIRELGEAQNQQDLEKKEIAERERRIHEHEKRLIMIELERREKAVKEREKWLKERAQLQSELNIIVIRLRGRLSDADLKFNESEKTRLEKELVEYDRIEKEVLMKEKVIKEQQEKLDGEKVKTEKELEELERTDRAKGLKAREAWLIYLEKEYHRIGRITIRYVITERHVTSSEPTSHTTHTRTVEEVGGERVTRDLEVIETQRVIKTVEYK